MTAETLLNDLRSNGFSLSVASGLLYVKPSSDLTDQQRSDIRAHKAALLALLCQKPCEKCNAPMERIEFGYYSCPACCFQSVEPKSGFWTLGLSLERKEAA